MRTVITGSIAGTAAGPWPRPLRACVHCGMCNATCPTYQLTGDELDGPRGRILSDEAGPGGPAGQRAFPQTPGSLPVVPVVRDHLPLGASSTTGSMTSAARRCAPAAPRPWPARVLRQAIRRLTASATLFRLALALGRLTRPLLPAALRAKVPPAVASGVWPRGDHARRMVVLKGCVQSAARPTSTPLRRRVFDKAGITLSEAPRAGCCGAVDFHLDAPEAGRAAARRNIDAWTPAIEAGAQAIVSIPAAARPSSATIPTCCATTRPIWKRRARWRAWCATPSRCLPTAT